MFINPKTAIENGWITNIADIEKSLQPNAIDFTLDRLLIISDHSDFVISEETKVMRNSQELHPELFKKYNQNFWKLDAKKAYDGTSKIYINLPEGVAARLIVRSTLNRNGLFITSGLWDSGFKGHVACVIHNRSGRAFIAPGTRIGQIIFEKADSYSLYSGSYNHAQGTHWKEKGEIAPDLFKAKSSAVVDTTVLGSVNLI